MKKCQILHVGVCSRNRWLLFFALVRRYTVILCTDAEIVTILVLMHDDARMELDGVFIFQPTNWPGVFFFWFRIFARNSKVICSTQDVLFVQLKKELFGMRNVVKDG